MSNYPSASNLLRARAEQHRDTNQPEAAQALDAMADDLDRYQSEQAITYLPLPTKSLQRLRAIWETGDDAYLRQSHVSLIRDVFDGQDGHLLNIDAALPALDPMEQRRMDQKNASRSLSLSTRDRNTDDQPTDLGRGLQRSMLEREAHASVALDRDQTHEVQ